MSDAPTPVKIYYASEYHRRNIQVARVCGAQAAVDQALGRAMTVKSIPVWLIAYLESAAKRLPGLQIDLAAWRDLAPDAPEYVRADIATPDPAATQARHDAKMDALEARNAALVEALEWYAEQSRLARLIHSEGDAGRYAIQNDGGKKARAAIEAARGE